MVRSKLSFDQHNHNPLEGLLTRGCCVHDFRTELYISLKQIPSHLSTYFEFGGCGSCSQGNQLVAQADAKNRQLGGLEERSEALNGLDAMGWT